MHTWQQLTKASQSDCLYGQGAQGLDGAITMGNGKWTRALRFVLLFSCRSHADVCIQIDKRDDPYAPQQSNGCCAVM